MKRYMILAFGLVLLTIAQDSKSNLTNEDPIHQGEKYTMKEVAFISWGEDDSLLGFIPPYVQIHENGDTGHIEPGYGVRSWDIGLDGKIYIADEVKAKIAVYDSIGHYLHSIGIWECDTNEIEVTTSSNRNIVLKARHPQFFNVEGAQSYASAYKTYFEYPPAVAVDGKGNIYVPHGYSVMKFSNQGTLLKLIDKFGEYNREDMKMEIGSVFSDGYGNIYVDVSLKNTYVFAKYNTNGELISVTEKMVYRQDAKGNLYEQLSAGKNWTESRTVLSISIKDSKDRDIDTCKIYFEYPVSGGVSLLAVDSDGHLFLVIGWAIHKYDQKGNLLAMFSPPRDTIRTFKQAMPGMNAFTKVMANGDIYNAYMSDQGFVVMKYELQQETKGQILEPAYIPEDIKKEKE